jgi:hypothetical protein
MDNFNENKNNNLEDKGWEAMRLLLDKEQPEIATPTLLSNEKKKENKRRFFFFLLLFLCLFGTSVGYYFSTSNEIYNTSILINNNDEKINEKTNINNANSEEKFAKISQNTEGPIRENKNEFITTKTNIEKTINTDNSLKYNKNIITETELQNLDNQVVTPKMKHENNVKIENKNELINNFDSIKNDVSSERNYTVNIDKKIPKHDSVLNTISTFLNEEKKGIIDEEITQNEDIKRLVLSTDLIEILTPKRIYFEDKNAEKKDYNQLELTYKINPKKWSYGVILGLNTEGPLNTLGGFGGIFLQRDINPKWSLNTGLNYRVLSKDVINLEYLQTTADAASKAQTTQLDPLVKVNKAYLQNLQYLELPIQINHHFTPKLSVLSGIKIGYLVSQNVRTIQTDNALFVSTSSIFSSQNKDLIINKDNYTSRDLGLRKWDIAWVGGINYRLNHRFSAQLRYDLGLTNIYQTEAVGIYNRFLGLNISYRF